MKILFDLSAIYDHLTGIERYAINISKNIILSHPENEYILIFKNSVHAMFQEISKMDNIEVRIVPGCNKLLYYQWRLMKNLYKYKADRYVFLSFASPWLFRRKEIINTIHDISAWDCPSSRKKIMVWYGKIGIRNAISVSKSIVTVSEFSKRRLIERLGTKPESIFVVYNGVSDNFYNYSLTPFEKIKNKYHLPNKYILCLSTLEPRKNMKLLIDAFIDLINESNVDYDLVLAGRKGWKLDDAVGKDIDDRIHLTGFIDDEDLPAIYRYAEMFVFPSIYEGFGIPIIEAMSQKTLVIASDSSSLPEVVGDAGILFKNNSKEDLKRAIKRAMALSEKERKSYVESGLKQIKKFDWKIEAEKYYRIIIR